MGASRTRHKSRTVIECSRAGIKIAHATLGKKPTVTTLAHRDFSDDTPEAIGAALTTALKNNHLKVEHAILSLDRSLASMRLIRLPGVEDGDLQEMAHWQAARLLPYQIDEIVVSYQVIEKDSEGFSHVLLVIVPRMIVEKYLKALQQAHIRPAEITISSEGLAAWFAQHESLVSDEDTVLVTIDANKLEVVVVREKRLVFSRSFSLAKFPDQQTRTHKCIEQIRLSLEAYQKQPIYKHVHDTILISSQELLDEVSGVLKPVLAGTVTTQDHLAEMARARRVRAVVPTGQIVFASSAALALSNDPPLLNLLPSDLQEKQQRSAQTKQLISSLRIMVVSLALVSIVVGYNFYIKKQVIRELDTRLSDIDPTASEIQTIKDKMAIIQAQLSDENSCIDILRELHEISPKEILLTTFSFEEGSDVVIKGTAPTMSVVFRYVPVLNKSPFFKNVEVRYATQRRTASGEITDFELICTLKVSQGGSAS